METYIIDGKIPRYRFDDFTKMFPADMWESYQECYNTQWKIEHAASLRRQWVTAWHNGEYISGNAVLKLVPSIDVFTPQQRRKLAHEDTQVSQNGIKILNGNFRTMGHLHSQVFISMLGVTA